MIRISPVSDVLGTNGECVWDEHAFHNPSEFVRGLSTADELAVKIVVLFSPESNLSGINHIGFLIAVQYRYVFHMPKS